MAWCGLPLYHFQRVVRCVELCPQSLNRPDLHFEGAGNGHVVTTWIGREDELYSGASPISLVEHCVTFRHDRRLLSLLGFVHNWPTSRSSATKKEKENRFSLNGNGIMSSFLGRQFYRSTLYISNIENSSMCKLGLNIDECISVEEQDSPNKCPGYDTKQSDDGIPVMLELYGMQRTPSLPSLPGSLWPGVIAPDRVLSMGQIELNCVGWDEIVLTFKLRTYAKLNCLFIYIKMDLALNNLQWSICHKTKPNQIIYIQYMRIKRIWHNIIYNSWYAIKPD